MLVGTHFITHIITLKKLMHYDFIFAQIKFFQINESF